MKMFISRASSFLKTSSAAPLIASASAMAASFASLALTAAAFACMIRSARDPVVASVETGGFPDFYISEFWIEIYQALEKYLPEVVVGDIGDALAPVKKGGFTA